jgi:hypothetical protein
LPAGDSATGGIVYSGQARKGEKRLRMTVYVPSVLPTVRFWNSVSNAHQTTVLDCYSRSRKVRTIVERSGQSLAYELCTALERNGPVETRTASLPRRQSGASSEKLAITGPLRVRLGGRGCSHRGKWRREKGFEFTVRRSSADAAMEWLSWSEQRNGMMHLSTGGLGHLERMR